MSEEIKKLLVEKDKEIAKLKKKLSDRNPAFNGNLITRSEKVFNELTFKIGKAITDSIGLDLIHAIKNKKMFVDYDSSTYGPSGWRIRIVDKKDQEAIIDSIADVEMKKFKDSLDNFSWAVKSNGQ